jgi:hypothetical protein
MWAARLDSYIFLSRNNPGPTSQGDVMLSFPKTAAAREHAAVSAEPGYHTAAGHPSPSTQIAGEQAPATTAGETRILTSASPAAVFISERQVVLASAAAGTAAHIAVSRNPWLTLSWLRLAPRSHAPREPRRPRPARRPLYLENAAMAREMERL